MGDWRPDKEGCFAGAVTYKKERTGHWCESPGQPWLQWPSNVGVHDPIRTYEEEAG